MYAYILTVDSNLMALVDLLTPLFVARHANQAENWRCQGSYSHDWFCLEPDVDEERSIVGSIISGDMLKIISRKKIRETWSSY